VVGWCRGRRERRGRLVVHWFVEVGGLSFEAGVLERVAGEVVSCGRVMLAGTL
jgi:hypothetical protein